MYKVLIVDDERVVRIGLQALIKWEEEGYELVGTVADGMQALCFIEENTVDIIITDLRMPNMDGLTLVKTLKEKGFIGGMIILTNYGEFEFAREAIRYGVQDYLLKATLRGNELLEALERTKRIISQFKENTTPFSEQSTWLEDIKSIEKWLEEGEGDLKNTSLTASYPFIYMAYLQSKYDKQNSQRHSLAFYEEALQNIIKEITALSKHIHIICKQEELVCILKQDVFSKEQIYAFATQIQEHVRLYTNIKVVCVLGEAFKAKDVFYKHYNECKMSSNLAFYPQYRNALYQRSYENIKVYLKIEDEKFLKDFEKSIKEGNSNEALKLFDMFIEGFEKEGIEVEEAKRFLNKLMSKIVLNYGMYFEQHKCDLQEISVAYRKCVTLQEIQEVMCNLIVTVCLYMFQVQDKHYRKEVADIIQYIQNHKDKKITLASIAEEVNMNESYISRLFKNETGTNIVHYISMIKMEKAKELLKDPDMRVKDVAEALGFEEQSYFNRMFKKYLGINPNDYKKSH